MCTQAPSEKTRLCSTPWACSQARACSCSHQLEKRRTALFVSLSPHHSSKQRERIFKTSVHLGCEDLVADDDNARGLGERVAGGLAREVRLGGAAGALHAAIRKRVRRAVAAVLFLERAVQQNAKQSLSGVSNIQMVNVIRNFEVDSQLVMCPARSRRASTCACAGQKPPSSFWSALQNRVQVLSAMSG